ncbi:hypothetical protein, partial [Leucobacter chromiireducens]|uniref:hypothetical protein n=1 Tax=Leucobacter chromiireducens TaxID=283877 RepID=UPI0019D12A8D
RALARAARASGVAVVRGAGQAQVGIGDAGLGVTERRTPELGDAGIVGAVAATDPALLEHAAAAAAAAGLPLALAPCASLAELAAGLGRIERAGLAAARVLVTDAAGLIAAEHAPGVPGVGVDEARLDALIDLLGAHGASVVFGGIGEIPSVRTVVSDHDVALAILRAAERGAAQLITLSAGARTKHRLSQYGGGGLEFVHTRFLPYLGRLGASPDLLRGASSANLARVLRIHREDHA